MWGKAGYPARQEGRETGSWHQTAEGDRRSKCWEVQERAQHNTRSALCTEYVSCDPLYNKCINYRASSSRDHELCFTVSICFMRINHMAAKIRLHSSSGAREVVSGTLIYSGFFFS
jgi:hypothetical protein